MSLIVDINKEYKDFSLRIKFDTDGKHTGLLGASGCGKSLTLKCIAGIETPDRGKIILNDRVLFSSEQGINLPPRQRNIGFLFQNYALFPHMTVKENIEVTIKNKRNRKTVVDNMLVLFHLEGMQNRYPCQLSGGEQQRVALARIMVYEPEALLLDEPFSALDSYLKDQLQQELSEGLRDYKRDILMVSHSRDELYHFCQTIAVLHQGNIIEVGDKMTIFGNPRDLTTAKLTGCKNISRAKKISDDEVWAIDWNISLKTARFVEEDISYIGIRAHNIKASFDDSDINTMQVALAGLTEGPFENSLLLKNKDNFHGEGKLWWIVSKQEWRDVLLEQLPNRVALPQEKILLLKENSVYKKQSSEIVQKHMEK